MPPREAIDELEQLARANDEPIRDALMAMVREIEAGRRPNTDELSDVLTQTMTLADLMGRRRVLIEARQAPERFADPIAARQLPSVNFPEAIDDLVRREPILAPTWRDLARGYRAGPVFGAVRSASVKLTMQVQAAIENLTRRGVEQDFSENVIREITGWTDAYTETVFRTNLNTAFTNGRFEQAKDPFVRAAAPALEFVTQREDGQTRPNHAAAHGLVAASDDEIWGIFKPPLGFNCRCSVRLVTFDELRNRGLLNSAERPIRLIPPRFEEAHRDPGF